MTSSKGRSAAVVVLLYLALTLLFTHPLVWHLATHYVGETGGDARIYVWNEWWVRSALLRLHTDPLQSDYIFYPVGIGLSLHTLALLHGLIFIPLSALVGDVAASNLIVLATFPASALGAYALARNLGGSRTGAFLAGLAFGFCPYRLARLAGHYDLLSTQWIPLYALAFVKAMKPGKRAWGAAIAAGLLGAACGYTSLTYLTFLAMLSLVHGAWSLSTSREERLARVGRAAAVAGIVVVLLAPLLVEVHGDLEAWRYLPYPGSDRYVADAAAYGLPTSKQTVLGHRFGHAFDPNVTETTVFLGYLVPALGLAAVGSRALRRSHGVWMLAGALWFVLSLGDSLHFAGRDLGISLAFPLLKRLPLLHDLRAPSRFSILVMLCLALLAAAAWTRWLAGLRHSGAEAALTLGAACVISAEYLAVPVPLFEAKAAPIYSRIGEEAGDFTVVEVPGIDQVPNQIMYNQTIHRKRIFIGTAARVPVEKESYYFGLPLVRPLVDLRKGKLGLDEALVEREKAAAPKVARFLAIRYFVVQRGYAEHDLVSFLEQVLPLDRAFEDEERIALRVRSDDLPPLPWSLDPGAAESRMYYESGWSTPEAESGRILRKATARRSTLLFKRPSDETRAVALLLSAGQRGGTAMVDARLAGVRIGRQGLPAGWTELRWSLPPTRSADEVERLELSWSPGVSGEESPLPRIAGLRFLAR